MNHPNVIVHQYTVEQARILLNILKPHDAETLAQPLQPEQAQAINEALDKLRQELSEYIDSDDGLGFIVPSRDAMGLI